MATKSFLHSSVNFIANDFKIQFQIRLANAAEFLAKQFFEERGRPDEGGIPAEWSIPVSAGNSEDDDSDLD